MEKALDTILDFAIGISASIALLAVVALIARQYRTEWEVQGIKLRPRTWVLVAFLFTVLATAARLGFYYWTEHEKWAEVGSSDNNRYTLLIADFAGDGGKSAADLEASALRDLFGDGVLISRVPLLTYEGRYGDQSKRLADAALASGRCARDYNGDVVFWGSVYQTAQIADLSYTVKGDSCFVPKCGLAVVMPFPKEYPLSSIAQPSSELRTFLIGSVAHRVFLPLVFYQSTRHAKSCMQDRVRIKTYIAKTENLLNDLSDEARQKAATDFRAALGFYQLLLGETDNNKREIGKAVLILGDLIRSDPAKAPDYTALYARALFDRDSSGSLESRRQAATTIASLQNKGRNSDQNLFLYLSAGTMWASVYELSGEQEDLLRASVSYEKALDLGKRLGAKPFEIDLALAKLYFEKFEKNSISANYDPAAKYMNAAADEYFSLNEKGKTDIAIEDAYDFQALGLNLSSHSGTAKHITRVIDQERDERRLAHPNWHDDGYVRLQLALSRAYARVSLLTDDARYFNEAVRLASRVFSNAPTPELRNYAAALAGAFSSEQWTKHHDEDARKDAATWFMRAASGYKKSGDLNAARKAVEAGNQVGG